MRYDGSPRGILLFILILAVIKLAVDLGLVFAGVIYFYKLCNHATPEFPEDRKRSKKR
jgi:hypothetical protein